MSSLSRQVEAARLSSAVNDEKIRARALEAAGERLKGEAAYARERLSSAAAGRTLFYDASRVPPYMANRESTHETREDAIRALADQFDQSPTWVEANMGSSNDLATIHANLVAALLGR